MYFLYMLLVKIRKSKDGILDWEKNKKHGPQLEQISLPYTLGK